jgi:hypothetical protein
MADVEGALDLVWGGEVLLSNGTVDSAASNCIGITYSKERVHWRLLMQPVGEQKDLIYLIKSQLFTFVSSTL